MDKWNTYFLNVCEVIASNSVCMSRHIGATLVRDKSIIATGYNGPPRGVPHCGKARLEYDHFLRDRMTRTMDTTFTDTDRCPRRVMGFDSGDGLDYCIAAHAELNCVADAARRGVITLGAELYLNDRIPCKNCLVILINAGISVITATKLECYDDASPYLISYSNISVRNFNGKVWS